MKPILNKLHQDHINFFKLLEYLDSQAQLLKECERIDLELILDAIRYMQEYPDLVHHPLEDVIYKYVLEHFDEVHNELVYLLNEHDEMPELTNKLFEMVQAALAGEPQKRQELYRYLKEYVDRQKNHMNKEESPVYSVIESTLSEHDWKNINSELSSVNDPMFGKDVKRSYQELLQKVIN